MTKQEITTNRCRLLALRMSLEGISDDLEQIGNFDTLPWVTAAVQHCDLAIVEIDEARIVLARELEEAA